MSAGQHRPAHGHVVSWDEYEGWGVLSSPEVPGEVWAHFSAIRPPEPGAYRALTAHDPVVFTWEDAHQDGYSFRAVEVRDASAAGDATVWGRDLRGGDDAGYRSSLDIRWDDER